MNSDTVDDQVRSGIGANEMQNVGHRGSMAAESQRSAQTGMTTNMSMNQSMVSGVDLENQQDESAGFNRFRFNADADETLDVK